MNKLFKGFLALVLSVSATASVAATSNYYTDTKEDHKDVDYSEMEIKDFSDNQFYTLLDEFKEALQKENNEDQVASLYNEVSDMFDDIATSYVLSEIAYYSEVSNEEKARVNAELNEYYLNAYDALLVAITDFAKSETYGDLAVEYFGDEAAEFDHEGYEQEYLDLINEEKDLTMAYSQLMLGAEDSASVYNEAAELYIKLLANRKKQMAYSDEDYDSYMQMTYEATYGRDYSVEEARAYRELVKKYFVPISNSIVSEDNLDAIVSLYDLPAPSVEDQLQAMSTYIPQVSSEFQPALDHFINNHLYDIGASNTKASMGFTVGLYSYRVPFIFNSPSESFYDYTTMFHEFGHYNEMYHHAASAIMSESSMDVSEIHSQGLELLMLAYGDHIYGSKYHQAADTLYELYSMCGSVVEGALYDEFQDRAFQLENPSVDDLSKIAKEVYEAYGYNPEDYMGWIQVSHTFESPFYYISYSTSALGALEIFSIDQENHEEALDKYFKLTAVDEGLGLKEALETVGLPNVMEEETMVKIVDTIAEIAEESTDYIISAEANDTPGSDEGINVTPYIVGGIVVLLGFMLIVFSLRAGKPKEA